MENNFEVGQQIICYDGNDNPYALRHIVKITEKRGEIVDSKGERWSETGYRGFSHTSVATPELVKQFKLFRYRNKLSSTNWNDISDEQILKYRQQNADNEKERQARINGWNISFGGK